MNVGLRGEEEGVEEVRDENEEDEGCVNVPAFEQQLELIIELLQQ